LLPVTVRMNADVPAVALAGKTEEMAGSGSAEDALETVNGTAEELTPKLDTVIFADPAEIMSVEEIRAVSCVELTNVVGRPEPFQSTTDPFTKFVPFTVRTNPEVVQDGVEDDEVVEDESEVMPGGKTWNEIPPDVPPPGASVNTTICAVSRAAKSVAGTIALSCVGLI